MSDKLENWEEAVLWLRSQPDQKDLITACYYDDPIKNAADRFYNSTEWREIQTLLKEKSGKVLDLGAGRGISSYAFALDGYDIVALEPNQSAIVGVRAIRKLSEDSKISISVIQSFAESIPFKDNSFEIVYGRQVLHHAQNLNKMCKEISRVLKPNGIFFTTREHVISRSSDLNIFLSKHPLQKIYGGENAFLLKHYLTAINSNGINITHILNNYDSDINLFPESRESMRKQMLKKDLPIPSFLLNLRLKFKGIFDKTPGRLYTFIGRKTIE